MIPRGSPTVVKEIRLTSTGAPELPQSKSSLGELEVTQRIDTWSYGCVLSVAATWVVQGFAGIVGYKQLRLNDPNTLTGEGRQTDRFHDGYGPIAAVKDWHDYLRGHVRRYDTITPRVLNLIESRMLRGRPEERISSKDLCVELQRLIEEAESDVSRLPTDVTNIATNVMEALLAVDKKADQIKPFSRQGKSRSGEKQQLFTLPATPSEQASRRFQKDAVLNQLPLAQTSYRREILTKQLSKTVASSTTRPFQTSRPLESRKRQDGTGPESTSGAPIPFTRGEPVGDTPSDFESPQNTNRETTQRPTIDITLVSPEPDLEQPSEDHDQMVHRGGRLAPPGTNGPVVGSSFANLHPSDAGSAKAQSLRHQDLAGISQGSSTTNVDLNFERQEIEDQTPTFDVETQQGLGLQFHQEQPPNAPRFEASASPQLPELAITTEQQPSDVLDFPFDICRERKELERIKPAGSTAKWRKMLGRESIKKDTYLASILDKRGFEMVCGLANCPGNADLLNPNRFLWSTMRLPWRLIGLYWSL